MSEWWAKVKNGEMTKIKKPKSIDALLNKGYSVSRVIKKKNDTKIITYSPETRQEYLKSKFKMQQAIAKKVKRRKKGVYI